MAARKKQDLEAALNDVRDAAAAVDEPESRQKLAAALASKRAMVVERAAKVVKEHSLSDFSAALRDAYQRLLDGGPKADPGCRAKVAVLEALDVLEWTDHEPFLSASRYVQEEAAWGPPVDTAAGVRVRGVLALARLGYADLPILAGERFEDSQPPVRAAVADALAAFGERSSAGLLLHKLRVGDDDPLVKLACMSALMALAPDWGLPYLSPLVASGHGEARELAALALGQSHRPDAADALIAALESAVRSTEREAVLRGLGLHRSDRAADVLLKLIETGAAADARAAVKALAPRRFEPGLREKIVAHAARNARVDLNDTLAKALAD
ncbi:MAG: HEAT repeat domain-containing protein [Myxococcales bacterium]|nr:HEAT repeat domain-containing protein [Myxococcales bacterium]